MARVHPQEDASWAQVLAGPRPPAPARDRDRRSDGGAHGAHRALRRPAAPDRDGGLRGHRAHVGDGDLPGRLSAPGLSPARLRPDQRDRRARPDHRRRLRGLSPGHPGGVLHPGGDASLLRFRGGRGRHRRGALLLAGGWQAGGGQPGDAAGSGHGEGAPKPGAGADPPGGRGRRSGDPDPGRPGLRPHVRALRRRRADGGHRQTRSSARSWRGWPCTGTGEAGKDRLRLIDFLQEEHIVTDFHARTKEEAIESLVDFLIASHHLDIDRQVLLDSVPAARGTGLHVSGRRAGGPPRHPARGAADGRRDGALAGGPGLRHARPPPGPLHGAAGHVVRGTRSPPAGSRDARPHHRIRPGLPGLSSSSPRTPPTSASSCTARSPRTSTTSSRTSRTDRRRRGPRAPRRAPVLPG